MTINASHSPDICELHPCAFAVLDGEAFTESVRRRLNLDPFAGEVPVKNGLKLRAHSFSFSQRRCWWARGGGRHTPDNLRVIEPALPAGVVSG
jgi:hypothetical protein